MPQSYKQQSSAPEKLDFSLESLTYVQADSHLVYA